MNSKKVFFIMTGALALSFVVLIASVVVGDMLLKQHSAKLLSLKLDSRTLDEQQIALVRANKDIQNYTDLEKTAKTIVPQDKDQAKTVREIIKLAEESDIPIASITFPSSSLGQLAPKAAAGSAPAVVTSPAITQVKPVEGIPGVYQMEISVQSDGSKPIPYSSFITFLSKLEQNRRTAQVGNINILPFPKNINLITFTLGINVFIKP